MIEGMEYVPQIADLAFLAVPILMAYTQKQKEWIRRRDGNRCRFPTEHDCNGDKKTLHIHHLRPQRYCERFGVDPDFPENGIAVCENSHIGNGTKTPDKVIHPDMMEARKRYREGNKDAYHQAFEAREALLDDRQVYWVDIWDRAMSMIALINTQKFTEIWPENHSHKEKPDSYHHVLDS